MSKNSRMRRPALEGLDSKVLLSAIPPVAAHGHHAEVAPKVAVDLAGTIHARGVFNAHDVVVDGSGDLGAVGRAEVRTRIDLLAPSKSLTLHTRRGDLVITSPTGLLVGSGTAESSYAITGGTRHLADATGSGTVAVTLASERAHRVDISITFS